MNEQLYGLTAENMMRVLPDILTRDEEMNPLGIITANQISKLVAHIGLVQIYSRIYEMPESVLDALAKDFKVDWYNPNYSVETKRAMIYDSFYVHNHLGTRGSTIKAISSIFPKAPCWNGLNTAASRFIFASSST